MQIIKILSFYSLLTIMNFSLLATVAADTMQDAQEAMAKKEYSTAIIHLKNQLKQTPDNARARFLLGKAYLHTGKLDSSTKELRRAHEYAPDDTEIMFLYADILQATGKYRKIVKTLKAPLSDKQQESQRLSYLGYAHIGLQQLADARQAFEQSNQLHKNSMAYNGLASVSLLEKEFQPAEDYLSQSLTLEPDNPSGLQLKAKLANLNKEHEQALQIYNQLVKDNTDNLSYRLERAATLAILKKDELAKADLKVILDKVKNHPQANFIKAQILLREKDYNGAYNAAQQVLNVMPQHMPAAFVYGAANFALGNYNQAVEYLIIYLSADPTNLKAQNLLANVYLKQKKYRQALLIMEGIPQEQLQKDPLLLQTLATIYIQTGEAKKGIDLLNQAYTLAPDNQDIRKLLISAQFQSGELDDAVSELEQLVSESDIQDQEQSQNQANLLLIVSYIRQEEFDKAEKKIQQLLSQTPDDTKLMNLSALTKQLKGETEQAISEFQNILKKDKNNIPAYLGLARIAIIEQNWTQAENYFQQIIAIDANNLKAYLGLAVVAEKQKKPEMTERYFMDAIEQSKNNITQQMTVASLLSQWYQSRKQPKKILALAKKLEQQHPNNNSIRSFMARAQLLNQQQQEAERTLMSIINSDKQDAKHRVLLAQLISNDANRTEEALELLDNALAIEPENQSLYTIKAAILVKQRRYEEGLDIATTMQQEFPDSETGKLLQADIYRAQKKYQQALTIYQQVYEQKPEKKVLSASIDMLIQLNRKEEAIDLLTQAVKENPQDIDNLFKLASLHHEKQQLNQAEQYYNRILAQVPNHIVTLNNLAWIYMEKDSAKAVKVAKQAHEQTPDTAAIIDTYGFALVKHGELKQGLELLELAQLALPADKDVQYHLAYAYEKNGQRDKALNILESLLKSNDAAYSEKDNAQSLYEKIK